MEIRQIRSLISLAEHGSIQEAAAKCSLSSPAVHKHLKMLETELGVHLCANHQGRLQLTEAGEIVLPFAKDVLASEQAAFTAIKEWKNAHRGLVRVGAGPSFCSYLLPVIIKRYRRRFPKINVFVETGDSAHLTSRLHGGLIDLVFDLASAAFESSEFEQVALWESQAEFVSARPDLPSHCRLRNLGDVPFILFQKGTRIEALIANYLDGLNFRPNVVMRSDSSEAIKAMIRAGLGISILFRWNVTSDLRAGTVSVIRTEAPPLALRMALIRVKRSYTSRPVQEFIELARRMIWKDLHPVADGS